MAAYSKFDGFVEQELRGVHNFSAHVFKVALCSQAPVAANQNLADIAQISSGNGYSSGGKTTTIGVSAAAGTTTVTGTAVTFTASGGIIGPFRYAVLYNATALEKPLVCWWDRGLSATLLDGESLTVTFGGASPGTIFTKV